MTEERLQKIIDEISDNGIWIMRPHMVMKAMKQAVNEALDEAARIATENMLPKTSKEIDNLKVK